MESKVHVRLGDIEVDCEGSEEFLRQEFPKILEAVTKLREISPGSGDPPPPHDDPSATKKKFTTATAAASFGCSSGSDLVTAAAAKLTVCDGLEEFSRDDLHTEMKKATGYYKSTYTSNLSGYLNSLVKSQKLLEVSTGKYAVPSNLKAEWVAKLA